MASEQSWAIASHIATFLKYSFTAATTALSVISLRHDTTYKSDDPAETRELTPVGRYYMAGVIALAAITIGTTIVGDIANSQLEQIKKQKAQTELDRALQGQLDKQLEQGIKPVVQSVGIDVARQSKAVLQDLEQQAEQTSARLRAAQDHLLAQTRQSSQKLTALNNGMAASAGLSRELLDRQQRLAEASSQVTYVSAIVTIPANSVPVSVRLPDLAQNSVPVAANIRKALFHGLPDIQTHLIVSLQYGDLSVADNPCPSKPPNADLAPVKEQGAPCLHAAGKMDSRFGPDGGVALGFPFEVATTSRNLSPAEVGSALRLAAEGSEIREAQPPVRAREMENTGLFLALCIARDGGLARATPAEQEAALRRADETLPASLDLKLIQMLRPVENGSEYSAIHPYTYVRVTDRPSQFTQGCLHPFYRVQF